MKTKQSSLLKFCAKRCYRNRYTSVFHCSQFARIFVILASLRGTFVSLFADDNNSVFII